MGESGPVTGKQSAISKYWGREAFFSLGVGSQIAQLALSSLWSQDGLIWIFCRPPKW